MTLVSIDNLAHRYGMLPSEALIKGSTFDLKVLGIGSAYDKHIREESKTNKTLGGKGVRVPTSKPAPKLSDKKMYEMLNRAKEIKNESS